MFAKRSRTQDDRKRAGTPRGPEGKRAYAIGDIHGRHDLLLDMLQQIETDMAERGPASNHIVFLGDLIDRGPASRQVIETLAAYAPPDAACHYLMGNHEEVLVRGLRGEPALLKGWLQHGGDTTAASYGIDADYLRVQSEDVIEHALLSAIPDRHIRFMASFLDNVRFGDYLFVHAGIRPGRAIEHQLSRDMRWIRDEFLNSTKNHGCIVVHGHTVEPDITRTHNRIGLDTGAYRTGILSALRIELAETEIIQARIEQADLP